MKLMKISVVVAGILLVTSGLISCIVEGARSSDKIDDISVAGCTADVLEEDINKVPEPSSHSSDKQSTKAPIQADAGCTDPNLKD